jgi:hypothetical protein
MMKKAAQVEDLPVVLVYHSKNDEKSYEWVWFSPPVDWFKLNNKKGT